MDFFDDPKDFAVLDSFEHPVARGLLVGGLLNQERSVGAVFLLPIGHVVEVPAKDVVAEHQHNTT
ncbi:hypothetical protein [Halorubrum distributum]|uniref:hypothetical protein n=1 Tax=Halorubrum distributum TaxID=29283 RepID=UPI001266EC9A|nr:hypothetical protein [Halorubrum litoreum]